MTKEKQFMLPLFHEGKHYKVPDDVDIIEWQDASLDELLKYISRNHTEKQAKVDVFGQVQIGKIFVSNDQNDYSFVLVNGDLTLPGNDKIEGYESDFISQFLELLKRDVGQAEGIVPEQRTYLETQYVKPFFIRKSPSGEREGTLLQWEDFKQHPYCVIIGHPGGGKTSFMRRLSLDLVKSCLIKDMKRGQLPIYLQMRHWSENPHLTSQINNYLESSGVGSITQDFERLKDEGRLALILDGLDETDLKYRKDIIDEVDIFNRKFPRCNIYLSTRPSAYHGELEKFEHFEVCKFNLNQIKEFSYRRLYSRKSWKRFVSCLFAAQAALDLVANPLMLSIAIFLFVRKSIIPQNRSQLLKSFVDALVEEWDEARGVNRNVGDLLSPLRTKNYLSRISLYCKEMGTTKFSSNDVKNYFSENIEIKEVENNLEIMSEVTGLIEKSSNENWVFTHNSFLDFLAASHLVERTQGLENVYKKYCSRKEWDAVWEDVAGLSSDPEFMHGLLVDSPSKDAKSKAKNSVTMMLRSSILEKNQITKNWEITQKRLDLLLSKFIKTDSCETDFDLPKGAKILFCLLSSELSLDLEAAKEAIEIMKHLYESRATIYGNWICNQLQHSKKMPLNKISDLFNTDGEICWKRSQKNIVVYLLPESLHIRFE